MVVGASLAEAALQYAAILVVQVFVREDDGEHFVRLIDKIFRNKMFGEHIASLAFVCKIVRGHEWCTV